MSGNGNFSLMLMSSYRTFISHLPGTKAWNSLYVLENDQQVDITDNGDKSCAYMVSGIVMMFGFSDSMHATIASTLDDLRRNGWYQTDTPQEGVIVEWSDHIGFFINDNEAISMSSYDRAVARHPLTMADGRKPICYWSHAAIESDQYKKPELDRNPVLPELEKGTYRHNKSGHLYEVIAVTFNVETNEPLVIYKPLYDAGYELFARPYDMFVKQVELNGVVVPRFEKTTS